MGTKKNLEGAQETQNAGLGAADMAGAPRASDNFPDNGHGGGRRFRARSDAIVAAAIPILNDQGFKGMRLADVAGRIGLKPTAITYYFPKKEDLALACITHGLDVFHEFLTAAAMEPTPADRVRSLISEFVKWEVAVRTGEAVQLASFNVIRALDGAHRERATVKYREMFLRARGLLDGPDASEAVRHSNSIRTLILLEQLYWAAGWLSDYDLEDAPRVAERMSEIALHGLSAGRANIGLRAGAISKPEHSAANEDFMRAATREINFLGYSGASIDRISAHLNMTKGAFYHWHDTKDELVRACYRRTFDLIREAQHTMCEEGGGEWGKLTTAVTSLVRFQLSDDGPLMRTSALSSLPRALSAEVREYSDRAGRTFASMISDAIAERSARPVDSTIAAYMLSAGIDAAADVSMWSLPRRNVDADTYVSVLLHGLLERQSDALGC